MPRNKEGSIRVTKDKIYVRVYYTDETGKPRELTRKAESLAHAKQLKKQLLRQLEDHGTKHIKAERMTFQELATYYIDNYLQPAEYIGDKKFAGLRSYDTARHSFKSVVEYFGKRVLRSITYEDIKKYRLLRLKTPTVTKKQRSIATVNRELVYFRRALTRISHKLSERSSLL